MEEKNLSKDYGWQRGEESERKVYQALEELKAEGKIKNSGQSLKFYQEDSKKRDFIIITNEEKTIWLQVKTSFNLFDKINCRKRGIQYLAVQQKTLPKIKEEILEIIREAKKQKRKPKPKRKIEVQIP